ncbi:phosphotransferase enzyme family protein [Paenibacillus physcomitrellae]|uniref:Aminoglycoside phosphotransferase n=1 Tax=Paenibacillus physcomitrellae TaxID=1619311 RepID=A0ABQ1GS76_9BACL|nr:phosphotransferase [Paenibacillus physcomitrellae]GGA49352.1 aminoglycoside phosphotransferase [Paenibacillus physcomitrellae]
MTTNVLHEIVKSYGIQQPVITYIRHSENRTYRIDGADGSYLLRIHQPVKDSMAGLQHTYEGLLVELDMLEQLAKGSSLLVQAPLRQTDGELIYVLKQGGEKLNCSILTWLEGRDLQREDTAAPEMAQKLGTQVAKLHAFFKGYNHPGLKYRPSQDLSYNERLVQTIKRGAPMGLFTNKDVLIIEETIQLVNSRIRQLGITEDTWGLIHGDLGMGNTLINDEGETSFIDFGFFGRGYYLTDIAMGTFMVPYGHRDVFLDSYYGYLGMEPYDLQLVEGFMLIAVIGFYAFELENEAYHDWMRERMPKLCKDLCRPYLAGERICYKF